MFLDAQFRSLYPSISKTKRISSRGFQSQEHQCLRAELHNMNGNSTTTKLMNGKKRTEACWPPVLNGGPRHRPLTPVRLLRGLLCLLVYISTAFMMLVYLAPIASVLLRLFSIRFSRKATSFFLGTWLSLWPYLFEKINETRVIFSGDILPARERVLLIANHRTEVDWMYLWNLALRKGRLGYIKYILKSSLMKLPIFGWGFHILDFISVERKWEVDELTMHQMLSTFTDPEDPLWLALFPEGTDFSEQKCVHSQKYASENGLPILENVLLPKTKGFFACLEVLRNSLDAVYDITIGYRHRCPTFLDNVFGVDPSEVHIHAQRVVISEIPKTEDEAAAWLVEAYTLKDQLLSDFKVKGHFPNQGTEGGLSEAKGLVNFCAIIALTILCTYLTFFSSVWYRVYMALSCIYLTLATTFNFRPSPIVNSMKVIFHRKSK